MVVDISFNARDENHAEEITDAVGALPGVHVRKVSDRTFLVHLGGKLEVHSKVSLRNRDDLSRAYTPGWPGSARPSRPTRRTPAG